MKVDFKDSSNLFGIEYILRLFCDDWKGDSSERTWNVLINFKLCECDSLDEWRRSPQHACILPNPCKQLRETREEFMVKCLVKNLQNVRYTQCSNIYAETGFRGQEIFILRQGRSLVLLAQYYPTEILHDLHAPGGSVQNEEKSLDPWTFFSCGWVSGKLRSLVVESPNDNARRESVDADAQDEARKLHFKFLSLQVAIAVLFRIRSIVEGLPRSAMSSMHTAHQFYSIIWR